jgi:hypothetical protein
MLIRDAAAPQLDPDVTMASGRKETEAILREFEAMGDGAGRDSALLRLGLLAFWEGQPSRAADIVHDLGGRAASLSHRDRVSIRIAVSAAAYFGLRHTSEVEQVLEEMRVIPGSESLISQVGTDVTAAGLYGLAGRFDESWQRQARALATWTELGHPVPESILGTQVIGETIRLAGQLERAERWFRNTVALYDELGETGANSTILALLGRRCATWDVRRG